MNWVFARIKWVMLVSGALTCTMVYAVIAPQAALQSMFGEGLQGPIAEIVVRNWGALITLVGAMLIYGAFNAPSRRLVLSIAALSKLIFIGLVLVHGTQYIGQQVGIAIGVDLVMVRVSVSYLVATRRD